MSEENPERDELPLALKVTFPNGSEIFMLPAARVETILRDKNAELARLKEERDQLGRKCSETKTEMDRALEWASCILDSWRTDYRENFRFHSPEADLYSTDEFLTRYPSNYLKDLARRALEGGKP